MKQSNIVNSVKNKSRSQLKEVFSESTDLATLSCATIIHPVCLARRPLCHARSGGGLVGLLASVSP
jgi:hypothetical protein